MPSTITRHARLSAVCTVVPTREIRLEDELEYYGGSLKKAERARQMAGFDKRRIAYPECTCSDLCQDAAEHLLSENNIDRASIDALIVVTQTPDYELPATACLLHNKLGLAPHCATFDVNQGCAGYVYGLWLASSLVEAGAAGKVLLLVGDANYKPRNPLNRVIAPLFGDAGSASLIEYTQQDNPVNFIIGTDSSGFDHIILPGGRSRMPILPEHSQNAILAEEIFDQAENPWMVTELYLNGNAVFEFATNDVVDHLRAFMSNTGRTPENTDWLFLHQANKMIIQMVAAKAGFSEDKTPWQTFSRYGNLSSASIPATMCDTFGGQKIADGLQLVLCGFGVGLSWAMCGMSTQGLAAAKVYELRPQYATFDRDGEFAHWKHKFSGGTPA